MRIGRNIFISVFCFIFETCFYLNKFIIDRKFCCNRLVLFYSRTQIKDRYSDNYNHGILWWRHQMETFSASLAFVRGIHRSRAGLSPVTGELPAQRPVTRSFDVFFDLWPNKWLSKQSQGWWFETPSRSLWRHCNVPDSSRRLQLASKVASVRRTMWPKKCCGLEWKPGLSHIDSNHLAVIQPVILPIEQRGFFT